MNNAREYKELVNLPLGEPGTVERVEFAGNGKAFGLLRKDGGFAICNSETPDVDTWALKADIKEFAMHPCIGEFAALAHHGNYVHYFSMRNGFSPLLLDFKNPTSISYNREGNLLACGNGHGRLRVWQTVSSPPRQVLDVRVSDLPVDKVYFGDRCVVALAGRGIRRVPFRFNPHKEHLEVGQVYKFRQPDDWRCHSYAIHPDCEMEAFCGEDGAIVFHKEASALYASQRVEKEIFSRLMFCPYTKRLIALGDKSAHFWPLEDKDFCPHSHRKQLQLYGTHSTTEIVRPDFVVRSEATGHRPVAYSYVDGVPILYWG
ncbi:MAG TPA: WD40 repeat domain-containing protein [Candidatus Melainabacteria bacterium]|nr:WD40 repeat domain-containing protein [Candidatus Melainabacteria bacterium]